MTSDGAARSSRARDALQRLFNVLSRDGFEIPDEAWQAIGGAIVRQPRISASSTVIFDRDIEGICASAAATLLDEPLLAQRLTTKVRTMAKAPLRLGEASCLPYDCVTASNALIVPTTPFDVDKTKHAPRLILLDDDLARLIKELAKVSRAIAPSGKWLFRFDEDAIEDDVRCNRLLAEIMRLQTGEPFARPQSLRANAYQELLWPGWRSILTSFLTGETTAPECLRWIRAASPEKRWTRAINSAVAAGHGAVDPGLLHYAGAWVPIYAVHYEASLSRTPPGHGWFERLKLVPESMERARRRAGKEKFDPWRWLESGRYDTSGIAPLYEPAEAGEVVRAPEGSRPTSALSSSHRKAEPTSTPAIMVHGELTAKRAPSVLKTAMKEKIVAGFDSVITKVPAKHDSSPAPVPACACTAWFSSMPRPSSRMPRWPPAPTCRSS